MTTEIDILDSTPAEITLPASGLEVRVLDLKTRQFFRLMKIITRGAGAALQDFHLEDTQSPEEFAGKLIAVVLLSIPEAEDEAIAFISSMVEPQGLETAHESTLSKTQKILNNELRTLIQLELYNPELEDTVTIIETIVKREAADIQSLGKRLVAMFKLAKKTGQLPSPEQLKNSSSTQTDSSEDSAEPLISLVPSTDG